MSLEARRVAAVISTYLPDRNLDSIVSALVGTVNEVIVVDDGSGTEADDALSGARRQGAHVLRSTRNEGIAAALNRGARAALDRGATHVLTLDQDSLLDRDDVERLLAEIERADGLGHHVAFSVPEYFSSVRQVHEERGDGVLLARHAIQSGMLIPAATFAHVGMFREDLFIDLVDTEFELRCDRAGFVGVAAPGVRLEHSLGASFERPRWLRWLLLGRGPSDLTLSTPFRYYYRVRNRQLVNGEFWRTRFTWVMRDTVVEWAHFVIAALVARPRNALWRLYARALRDARRGRLGRASEADLELARRIRWSVDRTDDSA